MDLHARFASIGSSYPLVSKPHQVSDYLQLHGSIVVGTRLIGVSQM